MMQVLAQHWQELWSFLEREVFSQPFSASGFAGWLLTQAQKGLSFTSIVFLLLFPVCVFLYYLLPRALRNFWLLVCSYVFYWFAACNGGVSHPEALIALAALSLFSYLLALLIDAVPAALPRRLLLAAGLLADLGLLFYVKYTEFFAGLLNDAFGLSLQARPALSAAALIGLSFYTLAAAGYLIDVCRGVSPAEKNPVKCLLFLSFFPQIVSGPICRSTDLLHQMNHVHTYQQKQVSAGLRRMLWGYFKKLVISENAAAILKLGFARPNYYNGFQLLVCALLYTVQLYADFSGYCDIALGAGQILGFSLPENFRRPYAARSIAEFWDRWHITLSRWLQDYIYIPLGGSRRGLARICANIMVVFLVSGLWHGAGLTFVVWGALHGLYSVLSRLTRRPRAFVCRVTRLDRARPLHAFFQWLLTFAEVSFAWIFFRAETLDDAVTLISRLPLRFGAALASREALVRALTGIGFYKNNGVVLVCAIAVMFFAEALQHRRPLAETVGRCPFVLRWAGYYALLACILLCGVFNATPFIYGQF